MINEPIPNTLPVNQMTAWAEVAYENIIFSEESVRGACLYAKALKAPNMLLGCC